MSTVLGELLSYLLQTVSLVIVGIHSVRLMRVSRGSMVLVFFTFALFSLLTVNCYWISYNLIRPDSRMPIAASEIGECATQLLLAESLKAAFRNRFGDARRELALTCLFTAASIALWIAWTGEWVQDIVGGLAFGYYLCRSVWALKLSGALSRCEWSFSGAAAALLVALETAQFFVPARQKALLDLACYLLMTLSVLYFSVKTLRALRTGTDGKQPFACVFAFYAWIVSCIYMSEGGWYIAWEILAALLLPLMFLAIKREVEAE